MQFGYGTASELNPQVMAYEDGCQNHHFTRPQHSQQPQQQKHVFQNHIPVTHQFVQNPQHLQHFQQQVQRMQHHNLCGGESVGHGGAGATEVPLFTVNFKLWMNENSGNKNGVLKEDEEDGNEQHFHENMPNFWQTREDSVVFNEPFWYISTLQ